MNNNFKESYIKWLYENIDEYMVCKNVFRLTLPYLDRNNDCIEIFIKIDGDSYTLTDDGETIDELELSNFNIFSSQRRIDICKMIRKPKIYKRIKEVKNRPCANRNGLT